MTFYWGIQLLLRFPGATTGSYKGFSDRPQRGKLPSLHQTENSNSSLQSDTQTPCLVMFSHMCIPSPGNFTPRSLFSSGSSAETSSWGEVGKSQRHSCSLWLSTQWFSTPSPCLLYSSQPQGPIKLLDPLICRSLNREMTPRFVLIHFALDQYAVPWRKIEQGNQQFLCFSLFLTLLQWVVFVFVFIKGFTVTFVLVCCCFNQLFQCLSSSALSSLAKLLTSKSIFSNGS